MGLRPRAHTHRPAAAAAAAGRAVRLVTGLVVEESLSVSGCVMKPFVDCTPGNIESWLTRCRALLTSVSCELKLGTVLEGSSDCHYVHGRMLKMAACPALSMQSTCNLHGAGFRTWCRRVGCCRGP